MRQLYESMLNFKNDFLLITSSLVKGKGDSCKISVRLETNTIYQDKNKWGDYRKHKLSERLIERAEKVLPNLRNNINFKSMATPLFLSAWTGNCNGAAYGWASTIQQFGDPEISQKTNIENLFLTGHWTNQSSGLALVANCGYDVADLILGRR